jgi:hypothetical protein
VATYYRVRERDLQINETTTVRRQIAVQVGTAESKTITVRKAGGTFAASASTAAQLADALYELTIVAGDIDTEGELAFKLAGATDDDYLCGLRVVTHDPFADVAAILADTGTDGVKIGANAISNASIADNAFGAEHFRTNVLGAEQWQSRVMRIDRELQVSEVTTNLRTIDVQLGTAEICTVAVSKNGGAYSNTTATTLTQVDGDQYKLVVGAADIDTVGAVKFRLTGATNTQYVDGLTVVSHDPFADINYIARRSGGGLVRIDTSDNTIKVYDGATDAATLLGTQTRSTSGSQTDWTPS